MKYYDEWGDKDKYNKNYDEIFRKKNDKTKDNTKKN